MSDPHALPDRPKTPRAPPLQPDRPGGDKTGTDNSPSPHDDKSAERQKSQSDTALDNVRKGYR